MPSYYSVCFLDEKAEICNVKNLCEFCSELNSSPLLILRPPLPFVGARRLQHSFSYLAANRHGDTGEGKERIPGQGN